MTILNAKTPMDLNEAIGARLEALVDEFVVFGAKQSDVFDAIALQLEVLRGAYNRDPDPADGPPGVDELEEPANDWPGAEPQRSW